ncbi:DUF4265 domain-containing protein [Kribbella sp. NPDC050820]|uniref:DUF4265 domain-containing protein n=1 Tax=Kribbella sp. NPDC050820 TaxID=3155408 RepID=UPI0033C012CD
MLTCHAVDGALVPIPATREADATVWFALPAEPDAPRIWEGLLARRSPGGETAQICAVPLFAYDLNFGDEVAVIASGEGALVATAIVVDGGNYTFRIWQEDADEAALRQVAIAFAEMGCLVEGYSGHLLGLSCDRESAQAVADELDAGERAGRFIYETGRQRTH